MKFKDLIMGIILFLVLLSLSLLLAYFGSPKLECENLEDNERDICFLKLAKEKEEKTYCSNIGDHRLKDLCSIEVWKDGDCFYEKLTNSDPDYCYLTKALDTVEIQYCYPIQNASRDTCFVILSAAAIKQKNILLCGGSGTCYEYFAENTDDCSLLEQIGEGHQELIASCYLRHAREKKDKSLCNKIPEEMDGLIASCDFYFWDEEEMYSMCPSAPEFDKFEECVFQAAKRRNNSEYCNMLTQENMNKFEMNQTTKEQVLKLHAPLCKTSTAKFNNHKGHCNSILDEGFKRLCLASFEAKENCLSLDSYELINICNAMVMLDQKYCDNITDFYLVEVCFSLHETTERAQSSGSQITLPQKNG